MSLCLKVKRGQRQMEDNHGDVSVGQGLSEQKFLK